MSGAPSAPIRQRAVRWLEENRASSRIAFVLRVGVMGLGAILSLMWTKLMLDALGAGVYGQFLTFLSVALLGGLGDFGISTAVGTRVLQLMAAKEDEAARTLLESARALVLVLSAFTIGVFAVLSPWVPGWLGFQPSVAAGSLPLLFAMGGFGAAIAVVGGYFHNLNYANGTVTWPIVPAFVAGQSILAVQWLMARGGAPLWSMYTVQLAIFGLLTCFTVWILKVSHPWLGNLRPVAWRWPDFRHLMGLSGWSYIISLGSVVFTTTDQILVAKGFGSDAVPAYRFNYKLCELAIVLLTSASFVALPAITRRLLEPTGGEHAQGIDGLARLQRLQTAAACCVAIGYLAINDAFISLWLGAGFRVPVALQAAFAIHMAIAVSGDAVAQMRSRLSVDGIRVAAIVIGLAGLLNFVLSYSAMKAGWILGIAVASVVAQCLLSIWLNHATCRFLKLPSLAWIARGCVLPLAAVALASLVRHWIAPVDVGSAAALIAVDVVILAGAFAALGIRRQLFVDEWSRLRASFR